MEAEMLYGAVGPLGGRAGWLAVALSLGCSLGGSDASAYTVFSTTHSFMGAGIFYGPGKLPDSPIFDVIIRNVIFTDANTFVTPFLNNGRAPPHTAGERATENVPNGMFSDGITPINENADTGPFELGGTSFLAAIAGGGPHHGEQISALDNGTMIMTMDLVLDMGIGEAGMLKMPFYGTTGEVTIPLSLQTQMGLSGGVDRAGSLASGAKVSGRLGDFNHDGFLDGAIVVAGNLPLTSIFMPGAPYALIRYFETDMPIDGALVGCLAGTVASREPLRAKADFRFPEDAARFGPVVDDSDLASTAKAKDAAQ
jgi:hypothetical protein